MVFFLKSKKNFIQNNYQAIIIPSMRTPSKNIIQRAQIISTNNKL